MNKTCTGDHTECIHDGVTSFIIHDYGEFEEDFEVVEFDGVEYNAADVSGVVYVYDGIE